MQFIDPEILKAAHGLSTGACAIGLALGFLLWALGWWGHRFWIVMSTTVIAGIVGLSSARLTNMQPFVAGLLLAIAAGMLALAVSRLFAFGAGGAAAWIVVRSLMPGWDEPLLCFLVGGLAGLFLFKFWLMALTSLGGTLIMAYSGLCLADRLGKLDALLWADKRVLLLNWSCIGVALLGWVTQFVLERLRIKRERLLEEQVQLKEAQDELKKRYQRRIQGTGWWRWGNQQQPPKLPGKAA